MLHIQKHNTNEKKSMLRKLLYEQQDNMETAIQTVYNMVLQPWRFIWVLKRQYSLPRF